MRAAILALVLCAGAYAQGISADAPTFAVVAPTVFTRTLTNPIGHDGITFIYLLLNHDGSAANQNGPGVCKLFLYHYPAYNYVYAVGVNTANQQVGRQFVLAGGVWTGVGALMPDIGPCGIDPAKTTISYPSPTQLKLSVFFTSTGGFTHGQMDATSVDNYSLIGTYHQF